MGHHGRMTDDDDRTRPEDEPGEPGAERSGGERSARDRRGSAGSADSPPPKPDPDDDSPVGDTDQHSDANA
jgi:hypothetical protein